MLSRIISILCLLLASYGLNAQDNSMLGEKRERHKVWRKHNSKRQKYNPYLEKKKKDKPSAKLARENNRDLKMQKRAARKQMRKSKHSLGKKGKRRRR